jgi:hypothetical protein
VHRADAVGDDRDPWALAVAAGELRAFARDERSRWRVRDHGNAGGEQHRADLGDLAASDGIDGARDRLAKLSFMGTRRATVEACVAEAFVLHVGDQVGL